MKYLDTPQEVSRTDTTPIVRRWRSVLFFVYRSPPLSRHLLRALKDSAHVAGGDSNSLQVKGDRLCAHGWARSVRPYAPMESGFLPRAAADKENCQSLIVSDSALTSVKTGS